ncbi:MAG: hypothetical protein C4562_00290, partial [Actinobacteria bacterium]
KTRVEIGISPHTIYTVEQKSLRKLAALARKLNLDLCMHVAESSYEVKYLKTGSGPIVDIFKNYFRLPIEIKPPSPSPVAYLKQMRLLGSNFCAVHAVKVNQTDLELLKQNCCQVVLSPRSNLFLGNGLPKLNLFRRVFPDFALGTDGLGSNTSLNVVAEAALIKEELPSFSCEHLVKTLTINGAKALGLRNITGSIETGKYADIIAISFKDMDKTKDLFENIILGNWNLVFSMVSGSKLFSSASLK